MTPSWALFKGFSKPRFLKMNVILAVELLAVVVMTVTRLVTGRFTTDAWFYMLSGWFFIPIAIGVVLLAVDQERAAVKPTFRMIPIADWQFYLVNILASLAVQLYVWLVQFALLGLSFALAWKRIRIRASMVTDMLDLQWTASINWWQVGLQAVVVAILATLVIWSTITFIHYASNATNGWLPRFQQHFLNVILTIVIIYVAFRLAAILIGMVSFLSSQALTGGSVTSVWTGAAVMLVTIIVESALNVWLLQKWVEPHAV
ncbi:ABC transporter permease [Lactiplantibacillus modestisalitolerans]|uniref:ABC transporter permease n=1 Tax=Lactiplantibacillus modestisalitolerans TaxID=1457219 RepID=A0ABV5WVZ3_9LACO|nr:ABC transporter permease [Lactiplantibacillus modestisalitolerans]